MSLQHYRELLGELEQKHNLTKQEYEELLKCRFSAVEYETVEEMDQELFEKANRVRKQVFGAKIYIRGLIEFTNYCRNNCYYCGIRRDNQKVKRYRLTEEEILNCCIEGYDLGYRTFVLQGGEDAYFTDQRICAIVSRIKSKFPDSAVTLSIGERSRESYELFLQAGADRYLLRHETANEMHYDQLHPAGQSLKRRKQCLKDLKELGYQVGAGFMVGTPGQTIKHLAEDLEFLQELQPHMIGIGPFISHKDTPFAGVPNGSVEETLFLLGVLRLSFPKAMLPATTALGTLAEDGRERGILAGANVVMPNLSPIAVREQYSLYDNKVCTGEESAQCVRCIRNRIRSIGYEVVVERGDYPG